MDNGISSFSSLFEVFNILPDPVVIINHAGSIVLVNQQAEVSFGYTYTEFLEKTLETLMPKQSYHQYTEYHKNYNKYQLVRPVKTRINLFGLKKDGTEFPIEVHLSSLHIDEGQLTVIILRDITDQMNVEKLHSILNTVVQFSDDAIVGKDLQGIITSWNKGAEKLYGYTASDAIGQSILMLFPNEMQGELDIILRKIERGESLVQFETVRIRKDGKAIPTAVTISPVFNKENKIIAAVTIARNISEQKKSGS